MVTLVVIPYPSVIYIYIYIDRYFPSTVPFDDEEIVIPVRVVICTKTIENEMLADRNFQVPDFNLMYSGVEYSSEHSTKVLMMLYLYSK